ncbi:MAG TPA: hypothetical protein VF240_20840 [Pyrinomonadaceae bacterium]
MRVESKDVKELFIVREQALDAAVHKAVRGALAVHKSAGNTVASWEGGRVVLIPAERIAVRESFVKQRK